MPVVYIRTHHIGSHAVCRWKREPAPEDEEARWEPVTQTDDVDFNSRLRIWGPISRW
jgi:hypothetical protein